MGKTEKLYDESAYIKEFSAVVTETGERDGRRFAALDRTAFFPEGGGQFSDTGHIGGARVTDAHERDGVIWHTVEGELSAGMKVDCAIDWARRFDFMQQHSGEHIFSGLAHGRFGASNVGFHLGLDMTTIDFDVPISMAELLELERAANEAVWKNLPIEIAHPSAAELETIPYRSKKELSGDVRIVTVPGYDICACCGTHVAQTGEIGVIKVLDSQNYKGGTRLWLLCGGRALADCDEKNAAVYRLSSRLSVKPEQLEAAERRLEDELGALKLRVGDMQRELFALKAERLGEGKFALEFVRGFSPDETRRYCLALAERFDRAAVFSKDGEGGWKYAVASLSGDVRKLTAALNSACSGRGGGKPELTQGSCASARAEIESFFADER